MRARVINTVVPVLAQCRNPVTLTVGKYGTPVLTARSPEARSAAVTPDPMDPFAGAILPPASFARH